MDEYLFFQSHKGALGPQKEDLFIETGNSGKTGQDKMKQKFESTLKKLEEEYEGCKSPLQKMNRALGIESPKKAPKIEEFKQTKHEFTEETMKFGLENISEKYKNQYMSAGFPPKICSQFVEKLNSQNRLKTQILDVGCGKGHVCELLKQMGFFRLAGMDVSNSLMQIAREKKVYESLEKIVFGEEQSVIPEQHREKYDFVISASMINNDGFDDKVFKDLLQCLKLGGFVIFATKLNFHQENQYEEHIQKLIEEQYWQYTSEHSFYRYDKNADGSGKFSNKKVKILTFQKTDHDAWQAQENVRKEMEEKLAKECLEIEAKKERERAAKEAAKKNKK